MKKIMLPILLLFTIIPAFAQFEEITVAALSSAVDSQVRIITTDDTAFQGIVYEVDDDFVTIIAFSGEVIRIYKKSITEVLKVAPGTDKKSLFRDSASNRLIVMPTGFAMEPGEFHVADQEIAAVTMSYGLSEHFTLWGGISVPGAILSARYIQKLSEEAALSVGTFGGVSWLEFTGILLPYTIFSYGTPENNFTIGGGGAFTFDETDFSFDAAVLALGGKWIFSDTTALVTETWIIWGEMISSSGEFTEETTAWDPVPMLITPAVTFRIAGEKLSWDIGAVVPVIIEQESGRYVAHGLTDENYTFIPIPILSLTYRID